MLEKDAEHFVGQVAQKAIIERDGKVLFVKSHHDERWDLPGGRLHANEYPVAGLKREVREEIGCECDIETMLTIDQYFHDSAKTPCVFINYVARISDQGEIIIAEDELSAYCWLDPTELREDMTFPNCSKALEVYRRMKS